MYSALTTREQECAPPSRPSEQRRACVPVSHCRDHAILLIVADRRGAAAGLCPCGREDARPRQEGGSGELWNYNLRYHSRGDVSTVIKTVTLAFGTEG